MTSADLWPPDPSFWMRIAAPWIGSRLPGLLGTLWRLARRTFRARAYGGTYEVLEYESRLELKDRKGETAVFHKRQRVRFLQDNVIAFQDQAWGDGEIFADYKVSPGVKVDHYREGHRYRILISLRQTMNRGDVEEFLIQRTVDGGFTAAVEDFQTVIDHPTRLVTVRIVFPASRLPKRTVLIERNTHRTIPLGPEHHSDLPDGRHEVKWSTTSPRQFETYILQWEW